MKIWLHWHFYIISSFQILLIRRSFYKEKVQSTKSKDPPKCWKQMKKRPYPILATYLLKINDKFLGVIQDYGPITTDHRIPRMMTSLSTSTRPQNKLSKLQINKASGPDDISSLLLKEQWGNGAFHLEEG